MVSLTKRQVDEAQPRESEWCLWDQQLAGFGLRIRPSGVKVYVVTYRAGHGRQAPLRRYTIGRHGAPWTPEQARREAKRVLGEVAAGQDPAKKRQRSRQADKEAPMVRDVAEQWLAEHVEAKRKARTLHNYRKLLDGVILPALGAKKMTALSRAESHACTTRVALRLTKPTACCGRWARCAPGPRGTGSCPSTATRAGV